MTGNPLESLRNVFIGSNPENNQVLLTDPDMSVLVERLSLSILGDEPFGHAMIETMVSADE